MSRTFMVQFVMRRFDPPSGGFEGCRNPRLLVATQHEGSADICTRTGSVRPPADSSASMIGSEDS